jgi:hypothetical protein
LGVIEYPDNPGLACSFSPYSFYLLGRKSLASLPNMPNYNLGQLENLNCDSILALTTNEITQSDFILYPNPASDVVTIECKKKLTGKIVLELLNLSGIKMKEEVFSADDKIQMDVSDLVSGMYFIKIISEVKVGFCRKFFVVR